MMLDISMTALDVSAANHLLNDYSSMCRAQKALLSLLYSGLVKKL